MKTLYYDGVAAVTNDEVADALVGYALVVAQYSTYATVTIPVLVEGRREELTLMLGPTIHLSAISASAAQQVRLDGTGEVVGELQRRAARLTEPPRPDEDEIVAWLEAEG